MILLTDIEHRAADCIARSLGYDGLYDVDTEEMSIEVLQLAARDVVAEIVPPPGAAAVTW